MLSTDKISFYHPNVPNVLIRPHYGQHATWYFKHSLFPSSSLRRLAHIFQCPGACCIRDEGEGWSGYWKVELLTDVVLAFDIHLIHHLQKLDLNLGLQINIIKYKICNEIMSALGRMRTYLDEIHYFLFLRNFYTTYSQNTATVKFFSSSRFRMVSSDLVP